MINVRHILDKKGSEVWSVTPDTSVYDALKLMADKNVGAVVVLDDNKVVGIMSERDYARKIILQGKTSKETSVHEIMTEKVLFVRPQNTTEECLSLMTDKRIRHLPVIEEEKLIGVISIGDVVKEIIEEDKFLIEQLENYISGGR